MQVVNVSNRGIKNFNLDTLNTIYETHLSYTKTKSINCSHNCLGSTDGFSQFHQLYSLDLSHNKINQFFQMASSLVELNLSHNLLGSVFEDFQKSLKSQGTRLYVGSFLSNLKNMKTIDFSYNNISTISSNIFDGNTMLTKINLSNNLLAFPLWCFNKLEHIESIDLAHNQLSLGDLKPLEKLRLESLNLKFNPLENLEACDEKLLKSFLYLKKIELSFTLIEQSVVINSKQSSKLDHSYNSSESSQHIPIERTTRSKLSKVVSRITRQKTPISLKNDSQQGNKTPIKGQECARLKGEMQKNISITPRKIQNLNLTPQRVLPLPKSKVDIKTIEQREQKQGFLEQKVTQKVPSLQLQLLNEIKVTPFHLTEINSERDDFPMLFEDDEEKQLLEELRMLGESLKLKKQHEVSLERSIAVDKNIVQLLKIMIKGVYLSDVNHQSEEFDTIMNQLQNELEQPEPKLRDLKISLMRLNEQHGELNKMLQCLEQSEKTVENIKQLV